MDLSIKRIVNPLLPYVPIGLKYGRKYCETRRLLQKSEWWSQAEILECQRASLRALLEHAFKRVPYCTSLFHKAGLIPSDISDPAKLSLLPVLNKEVKKVYGYLRSQGAENWSWTKGSDVSTIRLSYYKKRLRYSNEKLNNRIGVSPRHSFAQGMQVTAAWLRDHRYCV